MSFRVLALASLALALAPVPVFCREEFPERPAAEAMLPWSSPAILVHDLDAATAWYIGMLGFERVGERQDGTSRTVILSRGLTVIGLRPLAVETTGSVASSRAAFRGDLTLLVEDVDATVASLADSGVTVLAWPEDDADGKDRRALVSDPDGNRVVLREPLQPGS